MMSALANRKAPPPTSPDALRDFYSLHPFVRGYLEAMFFAEENYLEGATFEDLADLALAKAVGICVLFQKTNEHTLAEAYASSRTGYGPLEAGRDLWFTSMGHGVGFWDRGLGGTGEALTEASRTHGQVVVYRGDDGRVYLC